LIQKTLNHNRSSFAWNENWAALNFLQWKPALIYEELMNSKNINFGDILFYHDVNVTKYPEYLKNIEKWPKFLLSNMRNKSILLFNDNNMLLRVDCKKELIDKYKCEEFENEAHTWAGAIAIRKDENGIKFINEWVKMVNDLDNVSPITNYGDREGFYWHSQEQACLSILFFLNSEKSFVKKIFLYNQRAIPPIFFDKIKYLINACYKRIKYEFNARK
jgi:hypothetical protein